MKLWSIISLVSLYLNKKSISKSSEYYCSNKIDFFVNVDRKMYILVRLISFSILFCDARFLFKNKFHLFEFFRTNLAQLTGMALGYQAIFLVFPYIIIILQFF